MAFRFREALHSRRKITNRWEMPDYRAYIVGSDGRFKGFEKIEAANDEEAVRAAQKLVDGHDVEVWHLDRKITVLSHES